MSVLAPHPHRKKGVVLGVAGAIVLGAGALGAYAAAEGLTGSSAGEVRQLVAESRPGQFARKYGLNPADAVAVFKLRNGQIASVVAGSSAKCLIQTNANHTSETCDTTAAIAEGQAISVQDECGTAGGNLMEITGLAPPGIVSARLRWSDGSAKDATVTNGAFSSPQPIQPRALPTRLASNGSTAELRLEKVHSRFTATSSVCRWDRSERRPAIARGAATAPRTAGARSPAPDRPV